jgi:hypothetical protein
MDTPQMECQADGELVAFVVSWNATTFVVLCPHCGQVEAHTPSWSQTSIQALCKGHHISYKVGFHAKTLKQGAIAYEINREKKRLEIVGFKILESKDLLTAIGDEHNLLDEGKLDWDSARATRVQEQIPTARIGAVHLFLKLQAPQDGDSEEDLIAREAMGRNHVRERQRKRGAITYLSAVRTAEERFRAMLKTGWHGPYFSPAIELGDLTFLQSRRSTDTSIEIFAPLGTKDGLPFLTPFITIKGQLSKQRTVGILDRKGSYPPVIAVSGSTNWMVGSEYILDNAKWTLEVQRLACYVIHVLEKNGLDKDRPEGDTDACHVEKKLIAFFVQKHRFYEDGYEEDADVISLKKVLPGKGPREAWIAVDNVPCSECITFKKKVEACFGVKIHFVEMDYDFRRHTTTKTTSNPLPTPPASGTQQISIRIPARRLEEEDDDESDAIDEFGDPASPSYQRNSRPSARNTLLSPSKEHPNTSTKTTFTLRRKRALTFSTDVVGQAISDITNKTESLNLSKRPKVRPFRRRIIFDSDDEDEDSAPVERTNDDRVQSMAGESHGSPSNTTDEHEIIMISSDDEDPNDEPSLLGSEDLNEVLHEIQSREGMVAEASPELATDVAMIDDDRHSNPPPRERFQVVLAGSRSGNGNQRRKIASRTGKPEIGAINLTGEEDSRGLKQRSRKRTHSFFGPADPFDDEFDEDYIDCGEGNENGDESSSESEDESGSESWSGNDSGGESQSQSQSQSDSDSGEMDDDDDDVEDEDEV